MGFFLFHYYKKVDDQERRKGKGRGREREKREKGIREWGKNGEKERRKQRESDTRNGSIPPQELIPGLDNSVW